MVKVKELTLNVNHVGSVDLVLYISLLADVEHFWSIVPHEFGEYL